MSNLTAGPPDIETGTPEVKELKAYLERRPHEYGTGNHVLVCDSNISACGWTSIRSKEWSWSGFPFPCISMASHAWAMLGTIPLTPTFSRNRSSAEGLLRLDFGSHGRWLQMRGETNWVNDLRMHISLGIFINLILKELLLQSIALIVLAKKKQKTASGFFTTVQIGGQREVINLGVRRWLRKSGRSHLQDQHGCRELKNKGFEPCLWQCFCSGLGFQVYVMLKS